MTNVYEVQSYKVKFKCAGGFYLSVPVRVENEPLLTKSEIIEQAMEHISQYDMAVLKSEFIGVEVLKESSRIEYEVGDIINSLPSEKRYRIISHASYDTFGLMDMDTFTVYCNYNSIESLIVNFFDTSQILVEKKK